MDGTIIKLTTPVEAFGKSFTELTLREPKGGLYARLGEPRIGIVNAEGGGYLVEQPATISAYLEALVEGPDVAEKAVLLSQLTLADSLRLKRALFGFFEAAAAKAAAAP